MQLKHVGLVTLLLLYLLSACAQARPTETPPTATLAPSPSPTIIAGTVTSPATSTTGNSGETAGDPTRGKALFASLPCSSCHDVTHPFPGGDVCPNLGNIATEAERIVKSPDYHGKATDAAGYIHESIVNPNAYIVPGPQYHNADGTSVMPKNFSQLLQPSEIDDLVAYLMTLK